jgi:hypothetical protein
LFRGEYCDMERSQYPDMDLIVEGELEAKETA